MQNDESNKELSIETLEETRASIEAYKKELPELPDARKARLVKRNSLFFLKQCYLMNRNLYAA